MGELTPDLFISLWRMAKAQQTPDDDDLSRMQKFMIMHEDMHEHFDRFEADPSSPMVVDGENLMLHIAMDAAAERSLELGEPPGIRQVMQGMLDDGVEPDRAFHAVSQAMLHAFVLAAEQGQEFGPDDFLFRAQQYAAQARMQ